MCVFFAAIKFWSVLNESFNCQGLGYTLIYYTGKRPLVFDEDLPANVFIFNGRPILHKGACKANECKDHVSNVSHLH